MIDEKKLIEVLKDMNAVSLALNDRVSAVLGIVEGALERITVLEKTIADMKQITDLHVKLGGK